MRKRRRGLRSKRRSSPMTRRSSFKYTRGQTFSGASSAKSTNRLRFCHNELRTVIHTMLQSSFPLRKASQKSAQLIVSVVLSPRCRASVICKFFQASLYDEQTAATEAVWGKSTQQRFQQQAAGAPMAAAFVGAASSGDPTGCSQLATALAALGGPTATVAAGLAQAFPTPECAGKPRPSTLAETSPKTVMVVSIGHQRSDDKRKTPSRGRAALTAGSTMTWRAIGRRLAVAAKHQSRVKRWWEVDVEQHRHHQLSGHDRMGRGEPTARRMTDNR